MTETNEIRLRELDEQARELGFMLVPLQPDFVVENDEIVEVSERVKRNLEKMAYIDENGRIRLP